MQINSTLKSIPTLFIQAALVTTAAILALVLVTKYVAPIPLSINQTTTQKQTSFDVVGKSTLTTVPDKAVVNLGVVAKGTDLKQAQSQANSVMANLQQQLANLGVKKEDIKTDSYSIYPTIDYQRPTQNITGYTVNISLSVSLTDFAKLNQTIDTATGLGINQVNGVQFTLTDQKEAQVKADARKQAIDDAKRNAAELASLSGMRLGRIINVTEGSDNTPRPMMYAAKAMDSAVGGGTPTSVEPGSTSYTYSVTLSYETL